MWREFKVEGERGALLKLREDFKTAIDDRWREFGRDCNWNENLYKIRKPGL
jgi:hypothetical protein